MENDSYEHPWIHNCLYGAWSHLAHLFVCFSILNRCFISLFYLIPLFFISLFPCRKSQQDLWVALWPFLHCMTHKVKKAAWNLAGYCLSKHRKITFFELSHSKSSHQQNMRWPWGDKSTVTRLWGGHSGKCFLPVYHWESGKVQFVEVLWISMF